MSRKNVEIARRYMEEPPGGPPEEWTAWMARFWEPDGDYYPVRGFPEARPCHGREEIVRFLVEYLTAWEEYRYAVGDAIAVGDDRVLLHGRISAQGRASGVALDGEIYHCFWLRHGRFIRAEDHLTARGALQALGLTEERVEAAAARRQAMSQKNDDSLTEFIDSWQRNMHALRQFNDAVNRRDLAALIACCDPNVEIVSERALIGTPIYRGHQRMEQWFRDIAAAWEDLRAEPRRVTAVGDDAVVVVGDASGTGKTTGVPFESHDMATYFKFAHGNVARCEFFAHEREALEAARLAE